MPDEVASFNLLPEGSADVDPVIAHWPGDWPGRQFVDLDCVGDPGYWLDENLASAAELMDGDGDDYGEAAALADAYIQKGREMGFPLPSDHGMSAEEERENAIKDFLGFIREWRRRTMAERNANRTAANKAVGPLPTWEVLKEFGFQPDFTVVSDIMPGLSFDFGNFQLSASAVIGRQFQEVVFLTGVMATRRTLAEVAFEMPRRIETPEQCAAWLAWHLDKAAGGRFEPRIPAPWLELGRKHFRLLPWFVDQAAYEARPYCSVDRELARPMLKSLARIAKQMPVEEKVWVSFDGEVLKIRAGQELLAIAAHGKAWTSQFGLTAAQLSKPPRRLMDAKVWFESWEDYFTIAGYRHTGVVIKPGNNP